MDSGGDVGRITSVGQPPTEREPSAPTALAAGLEVTFVFAGILLYIWRWQHTWPHVWLALWAVVLASQALRHDTLKNLGLLGPGLRPSAQIILPLALLLYVPLLVYGLWHHRLGLLRPGWNSFLLFAGYGIWCLIQQYLAQSYFHNRLMLAIRNRHVTSALIAIMFSAAHIPNPILTVATFVAGFAFAEAFARYRNIYPLALAQAVGGLLLAAVSPETLIHHMRVGPGYLFYGLR